MYRETYLRKHCQCPYCKQKPVVVIQEIGRRAPPETFIRHGPCPFCGRMVEVVVNEYIGWQDLFQRDVNLRKPRATEYLGKKGGQQRTIEIYSQSPFL